LTNSLDQLRRGLERVQLEYAGKIVSACGGSTISDSVSATSQLKLRPLGGTKPIVILTDGLDTGGLHALNPTIGELQVWNRSLYDAALYRFGVSDS